MPILVDQLRAICGEAWVYTHEHELRTYESDGLLQYRVVPAVHAPRNPRCCGALMLHTGVEDEARKLARATIEAYDRFDHIVVNVAGCGSAMKEYGYLAGRRARPNILSEGPRHTRAARCPCVTCHAPPALRR